MSKRAHPDESDAKDAASAEDNTVTPLDRFKAMARRVVSVPREKVREAQRLQSLKGKQQRARPKRDSDD